MFAAQLSNGCTPDAISFAAAGDGSIAPGAVNNPSGQYCTFPPDSPLPRPKCCATGACAKGSLDNVAFQVFNVRHTPKNTTMHMTCFPMLTCSLSPKADQY